MILNYKGPLGRDKVECICAWLEEYVGPEDINWFWLGYRIDVPDLTRMDEIAFKLKFGL